MKKYSGITAWIIILIVIIFASTFLTQTGKNVKNIHFDEFQKQWINNNIQSFKVNSEERTVTGTYKDGTAYETTVMPERLFQFIEQYPKNGEVKEDYSKPVTIPFWVQYIPTIFLILIFVAFWFMFMQQSQGSGGNRGVMNFGKSRAKMATPDKKRVTFNDVAGADEEKAELAEIVDFLKQPKIY